MNQKVTVKTQRGDLCYFIIDPSQNIANQLAQVHSSTVGHDITYTMTETQVQMIDYFHDEVMGAHEILSIEDTAEPVSLQWNAVTSE